MWSLPIFWIGHELFHLIFDGFLRKFSLQAKALFGISFCLFCESKWWRGIWPVSVRFFQVDSSYSSIVNFLEDFMRWVWGYFFWFWRSLKIFWAGFELFLQILKVFEDFLRWVWLISSDFEGLWRFFEVGLSYFFWFLKIFWGNYFWRWTIWEFYFWVVWGVCGGERIRKLGDFLWYLGLIIGFVNDGIGWWWC